MITHVVVFLEVAFDAVRIKSESVVTSKMAPWGGFLCRKACAGWLVGGGRGLGGPMEEGGRSLKDPTGGGVLNSYRDSYIQIALHQG